MKKIITLCYAALLLSGCETIVDVDVPPHTPRLALSYTLSNQAPTAEYQELFQVRDLFVSTSQGVLERKEPVGRKDATVEILNDAGQVVERFRSKGQPGFNQSTGRPDSVYGHYVPTRNFAGQPGSTYTLRASAPGIEAVEATLTLPARAVIETGSYTERQSNQLPASVRPGRLTCSILDNAATTDYYLVYARVLDRNGQPWGYVQPDYNSNSSNDSGIGLNRFQLSEGRSLYNQYPFSDAGGNGQRLTLSADVFLNGGQASEPAFIEVTVSTITPDTYRFYQSLQRYYDTDGNPFAEPAPLFSNVRPGYGLFGGATDVTYRIPL